MAAFFRKKQLTPAKRICLRLKELRQKRGVSLAELAKKTKISEKHLAAMESCRFDELPQGEVYQKNFIKCYLKELKINPTPFLEQFIEEEINFTQKKEKKHPKKNLRLNQLGNFPAICRYAAAGLVVFVLIGYLGWQVKNILEPPNLVLLSPENGSISSQKEIVVQGQTENEVRVSINGKEIMTNERGRFNETVNLNPGLNTIIIMAEKKHGKKTTETRYVVLKENS